MRIHVAQQKHELEKENAGSPDSRCASEIGKKHLANHGLANEKEECAEEKRRRQDENSERGDQR